MPSLTPCFFDVFSVPMTNKNISILSWNVRGLGQLQRYEDVLTELIARRPDVVALQETKLEGVDLPKRKTFLPSRLSSFATRPSLGAAGGILTAWDSTTITLSFTFELHHSLTTVLTFNADGGTLSITNVYVPTAHTVKPAFLAELTSLANSIVGSWMLIGDFNLMREPSDKNTSAFNFTETKMFNDAINDDIRLVEIPLVDRSFTWSNKRDTPTLVRLDHCLVNLDWNSVFPNSCLSSLTRIASDHIPLLLASHRLD